MKLQACIGNGMSIMHIRDAEKTRVMNGDLVLCQSTVAFKDYRGRLRHNLLCTKCRRKATRMLFDRDDDRDIDPHLLNAVDIGVSEII
jgi:hypothetical protein